MQQNYINVNGEELYFYVQKKRIKNMILRVNKDKTVYISIPYRMSVEKAKEFIITKINWIKKQQNTCDNFSEKKENLKFDNNGFTYLLGNRYNIKVINGEENNIKVQDEHIEINVKEKYINDMEYIKLLYEKWLKLYAYKIYETQVCKYQKIMKPYGINFPKITVRQMKTRWGSCLTKSNKVTFSLNLVKTPMQCIEYVVVHELAHFKHPNHSNKFYNFIEQFMPDWKTRKNILNKQYAFLVE